MVLQPQMLLCHSERDPRSQLLPFQANSHHLAIKNMIHFCFLWTVLLVLVHIFWGGVSLFTFVKPFCSIRCLLVGARLMQGFPRGSDVWRRNINPCRKSGMCLERPVIPWGQELWRAVGLNSSTVEIAVNNLKGS